MEQELLALKIKYAQLAMKHEKFIESLCSDVFIRQETGEPSYTLATYLRKTLIPRPIHLGDESTRNRTAVDEYHRRGYEVSVDYSHLLLEILKIFNATVEPDEVLDIITELQKKVCILQEDSITADYADKIVMFERRSENYRVLSEKYNAELNELRAKQSQDTESLEAKLRSEHKKELMRQYQFMNNRSESLLEKIVGLESEAQAGKSVVGENTKLIAEVSSLQAENNKLREDNMQLETKCRTLIILVEKLLGEIGKIDTACKDTKATFELLKLT